MHHFFSGFSVQNWPGVPEFQTIDENTEHITIQLPSDLLAEERFSVKLQFLANCPASWKASAESFHFISNIKQSPENFAGAHVFRSPVVILSDGKRYSALVPDLHDFNSDHGQEYFLDMRFDEQDAAPPTVEYGLCPQAVDGHRYYKPSGDKLSLKAGFTLSFYLLTYECDNVADAVGTISDFIYNTFATHYEHTVLPQTVLFEKYALYGNGMAASFLYQSDENGGGICLTGFRREDEQPIGREYADDQWFHAWFNNMRTAHELYHFGQKMGRKKWSNIAADIAKLLIHAPSDNGIFATIYAPHSGGYISSSLQGGGPEYLSLPDCAWSAYWLLRYVEECEKVSGADEFLRRFADGLLVYATPENGYIFPTWVYNKSAGAHELGALDRLERKKFWYLFDDDFSKPSERLVSSTSAALPMWFLAEYALRGGGQIYQDTAKACADSLLERFLPKQKFEDFELYYSCAKKRESFYDSISRMYGQNTLSMQWCAEGFLALYKLCGEGKYLSAARYCISILSLYQQVWNPPFLSLYAFGGFGVMNTDAEWNDARQAQFAETLSIFYDMTGDFIYLRRAVAAMRAAFTLVAMNENKTVSPNTFEGTTVLFEVHGGSSENYGHSGYDTRAYQSGFHWGTGSALVTAAKLQAKYGDVWIDGENAIGIDGVAVKSALSQNGVLHLVLEVLPERGEMAVKFRGGEVRDVSAQGFTFDKQRSVLIPMESKQTL